MTELKPCPWCGIVPELRVGTDPRAVESLSPGIPTISCRCHGCCHVSKYVDYGEDLEAAKAEVIERWNRRV